MKNLVLFLFISVVASENAKNSTDVKEQFSSLFPRQSRGSNFIYAQMIMCAVRSDSSSCFVDLADDVIETKRNEILAQADQEVAQATGRSDPDNSPSAIAKTIERLLSELTGLFRNGLTDWFSAKEGEDGNEIADGDKEENKDVQEDDTTSRDVGEPRTTITKKKKKKPLKRLVALIKVVLLAALVWIKVSLLSKVFEGALKLKLLMVALGSFAIQAAKFWMDIRSKKDHHEENIVFKNPYEGTGEWSGPGVPAGGEYHGRNFDSNKIDSEELAYSHYRPT